MSEIKRDEIQLSHVAILVPSVKKTADHLAQFGFNIGPEETFEGEGTKEIYIEKDCSNSLLLMEAISPGPYQRAFEKRGAGLHHLAIDVLNIENFLETLVGSGWLLHPMSIKTMKQSRVAYLARPGFPALIEVQEKKSFGHKESFVQGISLNFDPQLFKLLRSVGLSEVVKLTNEEPGLILRGNVLKFSELNVYS